MKYHIVLKFFAVILCALCLLASVAAVLGIAVLVEGDLYNTSLETLRSDQIQRNLVRRSNYLVMRYAAAELGNCPDSMLYSYLNDYYGDAQLAMAAELWSYSITDGKGLIVDHFYDRNLEGLEKYECLVMSTYPEVIGYELRDRYTGEVLDVTTPTVPGIQEEQVIPGTVMPPPEGSEYLYIENWSYQDRNGIHVYTLGIRQGPEYLVKLYLQPDELMEDQWLWDAAALLYEYRFDLSWILGAAVLLFALLLVYLCCAAGKKPGTDEIAPGGLNRLPLDLYGVGVTFAVAALVTAGYEMVVWWAGAFEPIWLLALAVCAVAYIACLLIVAFLFACGAQFKMKGFYWVKHSLVGLSVGLALRVLRKIFGVLPKVWNVLFDGTKKIFSGAFRLIKAIVVGFFGLLGKLLRGLWRGLDRFFRLLPLMWQWLLVGFGMILLLLIGMESRSEGFLMLGILACICTVLYAAHCFGFLLESTRRMSQGDLDTKVEDKLLLGGFRQYAQHLNALAGVAVEAARKQMRSERMKAELVTNVSHDIKTPLTSIINYVDLLQKAQSQEEAQTYLEVLERQSQRLKKLIEDLIEMSKASTGNMNVELTRVDAQEAINQALGEFSGKLEEAQVTPVYTPSEQVVYMNADGRLTWRVLSNLLSNAVKYAMPGTRLYIDLTTREEWVEISLKNISAQQLNVRAEELLERFVRGDASRNTDGSGLGLNIAKSLMELQGGKLELQVDGDLFKVILSFRKDR